MTFGRVVCAALAMTLAACGAGTISDGDAKSRALAILPTGTAVSVAAVDEGTTPLKQVLVKMPGDGTILVYLLAATGELDKMVSTQGPFEYEIAPAGALSYTAARTKAYGQKDGVLEAWKYDHADGDYEFYIRVGAQLWEVKLAAKDGAVLDVVQKQAVD